MTRRGLAPRPLDRAVVERYGAVMGTRYFTPDLFAFLRDLASHNDRDWFKSNQERYEASVRQPALDFITEFGTRLGGLSPHFVADARTVGGSLFRIQRDTRFSKDKTPYKTNTGVHFRHEAASDAYAPGFYLHLEPRNCFMGAGLWHPETRVAYEIRNHIAAHPARWQAVTGDTGFSQAFSLTGDSLARPPKGFDPGHPLIEDLKRKDFIASAPLTQSQITSVGFIDEFEQRCRQALPFVRFICEGVGLPC